MNVNVSTVSNVQGYFSKLGTQLAPLGGLFKNLMLVMSIIVPILVVFFLIKFLMEFKHTLHIKIKTDTGDITKGFFKFRLVQKAGVNQHIQIRKGFVSHPCPDFGYFELQQNGKYIVTAYEEHGGHLRFVKTEEAQGVLFNQEVSVLDWDFYDITERKRKEKWSVSGFLQFLNQYGGAIICLLTVVILVIYWKDINQPQIDREKIALERDKVNLEVTKNQMVIIGGLENILGQKILMNQSSTVPVNPIAPS